jgi:hypothetical protein
MRKTSTKRTMKKRKQERAQCRLCRDQCIVIPDLSSKIIPVVLEETDPLFADLPLWQQAAQSTRTSIALGILTETIQFTCADAPERDFFAIG